MKVRDIMQEPAIVVSDDDALEVVARVMLERQAPCVGVVDAAGRLVGVICDDEFNVHERRFPFSLESAPHLFGAPVLLEAIEQEYAQARRRKARDVMTADPVVLSDDEPLERAVAGLERKSSILVVRGDRPVGLLTRLDLAKLVASRPREADRG